MNIIKSILLLGIIMIVFVSPSIFGGYYFSEDRALSKSYPNEEGEVVFETPLIDKKIVIYKVGETKFVKLVEQKWGILYNVNHFSVLNQREPDDLLKWSWSAHLNDNDRYDTLLAVEVLNPEIKKVIISNEGFSKILNNIDEVKSVSRLYIELDVRDGYAATYADLSSIDAGNFIFRGLNDEGVILETVW